nr:reverse transcriptase domain-containing protein [Tanacetum cinerariifolium]
MDLAILFTQFVRAPTLPVGSPVRPPVLPPRGATVCRPELRVVILGDIVYTREGIGNIRVGARTSDQDVQRGDQGIRMNGGDDEVLDFSTIIAQQLQDLLPTIIAQVGNHASNIQCDVRSVNVGNGSNGYSYKKFRECNQKDYDGKDGQEATAGMTWEDFKDLMRNEFYPNNEMQKLEIEFWCYAMVEAGHATCTDRFHVLARLVPHLVTPKKRIERYIYDLALQIRAMVAATEPTKILSFVFKAGMLADEAIRNGSLKNNTEKKGNCRELSRKENVRDDNKRSRTSCNTPKLGRSGIWVQGVLLHRSITQDIY